MTWLCLKVDRKYSQRDKGKDEDGDTVKEKGGDNIGRWKVNPKISSE